MNKLLILFLLVSLNSFSQFKLTDESLEEKSFRMLHRPSPNNKLSQYLKSHITAEELQIINNSLKTKNINSLRIVFDINKNGRPWNFRGYTGNKQLNQKLYQLVTFFLTNEIPNLADLYQARHKIQLFTRENDTTFINASTVIVSDYPPKFDIYKRNKKTAIKLNKTKPNANSSISDVFNYHAIEDCQSAPRYTDAYGCFSRNFEKFIIANFNKRIFKEENIIGFYKLPVKFEIDKKGKLHFIPSTNSNSIFTSTLTKSQSAWNANARAFGAVILNAKSPENIVQKKDSTKTFKTNIKANPKTTTSNETYLRPINDTYDSNSLMLDSFEKISDTVGVAYEQLNPINKEVVRLMKLFEPNVVAPSKRNNVAVASMFSGLFDLFIPEILDENEIETLEQCAFTKFFNDKLDQNLVTACDKPKQYPRFMPNFLKQSAQVKVFFYFNHKGKLDQVWANALNVDLNKDIVSAFKKYPLDSLQLDKSINKLYSLVVIRDIANKKYVLCDEKVQCSIIGEYTPCEDCKNLNDIKKHNNEEISNHIKSKVKSSNYSFKLKQKAKSDNTNEILIYISIAKNGSISPIAIHIKDTSNSISGNGNWAVEKLKSIISEMPNFTKPHKDLPTGFHNKKFVFHIDNN
ncbi:hypothetical protein KFZ70_10070 [Tamlana fucoidanivorans]|uniref:Uncharacterized protein n=1 Tax=Allotamlana fucoidanivorans TaxID=2583814 RepID=A0A5C4SNN3_9FLAO|nr:hypothetical protein [Tamlana fucoidanivorans]TNJ45789.1 hypothetical protein FGF67_05255 [Tamlana fucoidanivorans]